MHDAMTRHLFGGYGHAPPCIRSLVPGCWLEAVLACRDERAMLRTVGRYFFNLTIVDRPSDLAELLVGAATSTLNSVPERAAGFGPAPRAGVEQP